MACNSLPKQIIFWLVNHFDIPTRTFFFPNGHSFTLSSQHIHHVLGTPIGGQPLPKICSEDAKNLVQQETNCQGNHPTINELKALITPDLAGHKFLRIFALFALTSLLCPTSSDCASPEFYEAIYEPEKIISYDWSTIITDKLVSSISKFQQARKQCTTASLGGCTIAILVCCKNLYMCFHFFYFSLFPSQCPWFFCLLPQIIYLELLDTSEISLPNYMPRLSIWSTEIIMAYIELDKMNDDGTIFGRIPVWFSYTDVFSACFIFVSTIFQRNFSICFPQFFLAAERYQEVMFLHSLSHLRWHFHRYK